MSGPVPLSPFEMLEPPPGGSEMLRWKLGRRRRRAAVARAATWAAAVAVPAALVLALVLVDPGTRSGRGPRLAPPTAADLALLGLYDEEPATVTVPEAERSRVAVQVVVETDEVAFYRIVSLARPAARAGGGA